MELDSERATKFKRLANRANYLSSDHPDIQLAAKELCRSKARPTEISWNSLGRLARYLKLRPRFIIRYAYQNANKSINTCVDACWAREQVSNMSTSGGLMQKRAHDHRDSSAKVSER